MPKAVRFHKLGGPKVLQIEEVPVRHPEAGEVAINVAAVGLNRAESMYYRGNYSQKPDFPSGLGYEVVGTVTAVAGQRPLAGVRPTQNSLQQSRNNRRLSLAIKNTNRHLFSVGMSI